MNCIHSHEGGAYCDKHDHGAVTVGCCGEESCPDRKVLTRDDGYVLKSSVLSAIHNGDIDMGMVTTHEYRLLKDLSERIDRRIQRVPVSDVQPVRHGRWELDVLDGTPGYRPVCIVCSECHRINYGSTPYCPNCGCAMEDV